MFGDFMMGAKSRLLPLSLPGRFFLTAALFQVAAWGLLLVFADQAVGFEGGPGPVLASLHAVTLGVLAMTGMGAAFQLLPVATKQPVRSEAACKAVFWLYVPGLLLLGHGMSTDQPWALMAGGGLVVAALLLFGFLLADNTRRAGDMRIVTLHAWLALASLLALLTLAALLIRGFITGFSMDHRLLGLAHAVIAAYGFMGMLAMGFSFVLIPMFCLSPPPDVRLGAVAAWCALAALLLTAAGLLAALPPLVPLGGAVGLVAAGLHLRVMAKVMKSRMRRKLGDSFILIRLGWALLPLSILAGMATSVGLAPARLGPLFGFWLVFGWLLTFLLGVLQRILPFLASMHSVRPGVKPVLVSALTPDRTLRLHLILHVSALVLVSAGLAGQWALAVRLGAAGGAAGALVYLAFVTQVLWRLHRHCHPPQS
ncbi:hypothetical protein GALL_155320 [mine drainage metagenome]|uniref:NnrS protein n=1 Tax=mine drainage metagenome TaxID=410659 RepID=A0A1J5S2A7_9ZZZZ